MIKEEYIVRNMLRLKVKVSFDLLMFVSERKKLNSLLQSCVVCKDKIFGIDS